MLEKETWKNVPSYESLYMVSNFGRVKRLKGFDSIGRIIYEKILKPSRQRYYGVSLYKNGKAKYYRIHQLVAMAFLEHKPSESKMVIDHIDNNPSNNRLDNLQIITQRDNCRKDKVDCGAILNKISGKWEASIMADGIRYYLGRFNTREPALKEYQRALTEYNEKGIISRPNVEKKSSSYKGVSWHKNRNKWIAFVRINDKIKYLGYFLNERDAYLKVLQFDKNKA